MEKEIEGTKSNEKSTTKKNIGTSSDKTLCVPSTTIAIKIYRKLVTETSTTTKQKHC